MGIFRQFAAAALALAMLAGCGLPGRSAALPALPTAHVVVRPAAERVIAPTPKPIPSIVTLSPIPQSPTPPSVDPITPSILAQQTPSTQASSTPPADQLAWLEGQLIDQINQVRAANGLPAYHASPELSAAARAHSCDLAAHHLISHSSSDGRVLADRLSGANPPWEWPSESIAAGTADAATVVAWWMDEPPEGWHRRNILDQQQRDVGAGYCFAEDDPTGNHHYWTADFSRRAQQ